MMRRTAGIGGMLVVAIIGACAPIRTDVLTAAPDADFDLSIGGVARIDGTTLLVRFDTVSEDSRCPTDVQCVWQGNATVQLTVDSSAVTRAVELRSSVTQPGQAFGRRIELRALRPTPVSTSPLNPRDYVATLRVSD